MTLTIAWAKKKAAEQEELYSAAKGKPGSDQKFSFIPN